MSSFSSNPLTYPRSAQGFDHALFRSPSAEYRGAPLWSWNTRLDKNMLMRQIDVLQEMGMGGFHMHVRIGLDTPYLGEEFMAQVHACVDYAAEKGMLACLYDEDRWPSGGAGGLVTESNPEYASQHILLTLVPYGQGVKSQPPAFMGYAARSELGILLARYEVELNELGELRTYRRLLESDEANDCSKVFYAYMEPNVPSPWFNDQTYADTLNPKAIQKFMEITHEKYKKSLATKFGNVVPSIFCDEPQFQPKTQLPKATSTSDIFLPWTHDLSKSFKASYGYEILDKLPELIWNLPENAPSLPRYHFHDHVCERFVTAFMDQLSTWCRGNGIALTGHMMEEPFLKTQTASLGEAMRCYRGLDLPGVDMLCDQFEYNTVKQATSVARQNGARGAMCEIYGVTNWTFTFEGHKGSGDWQAALGITFRVHHLAWLSMAGEAKRDFPATIGYQSPWYKEYSIIEDYFSRLNVVLTRGKPVTRVAVIHPIESYWLCYGPSDSGNGEPEFREQCFRDLTHWLLHGLVDFDFISESLFPDQTRIENITNSLHVGASTYDAVILPNLRTIRSTTLSRLQKFAAAGGTVIVAGEHPTLVDAAAPQEPPTIPNSTTVPWTEFHILRSVEAFQNVRVETSSGQRATSLLYQLREDHDAQFLFICNTKRTSSVTTNVRIRGSWQVSVMDIAHGDVETELDSSSSGEWTVFPYHFDGTASVLFSLKKGPQSSTAGPQRTLALDYGRNIVQLRLKEVVLQEPNVLLLDYAEHRLSADAEWAPVEEVLRIDNIVRRRLDLPLKLDNFKQPWAIPPKERQPLDDLHLRFTFRTNIDVQAPVLALEDASLVQILLDGTVVPSSEPSGYWVDEAIQKVALPAVSKGNHTLEIIYPFGILTNLERVYILGDFGVQLKGSETEIVEKQRLTFGDWTRQGLPFYAGNATYECEFVLPAGPPLDVAVSVPQFSAPVLSVTLDSKALGHIYIEPRILKLGVLEPGPHSLSITSFGNRENAFGMLHLVEGKTTWFGPNEFRTDRPGWWQREYDVKKMGILAAPSIIGLGHDDVAVQPHILRFNYERAEQRP